MTVKLQVQAFKKLLAKKNLSQNAFAKRLRVSSGYMSQMICGQRNPSPQLRERILEILNKVQKMREEREFQFDDLFLIKGR